MPCNTPFRGDSSQLLLYKIASCCFAGGEGGAGVSSFNGRTGAVTLTPGDVSGVADDLYVNETGDSMTGALFIDNGVLAASAPALSLSQTWNNAAVTFTGLYENITLTAASSNSNLFNFQVGGSDRFNFTSGGTLRAIRQDASNSGVNFFLRKRGNAGDATGAVAADSTIGAISYSGWDGTAFATGSHIDGLAAEAWTNVAHGSRINFYTTPIGSTTEQISLRLDASGQARFLDGTAAIPALTFQSDTNTGIYRIGADILGFSTAGTERVRIDAAGLVGVGVTPIVTLDVAGQARVTGSSGAVGAPGSPVYGLSIQNNANSVYLEFLNNGGVGKGSFFGMFGDAFEIYNYQAGPIVFFTATAASTFVERLRILADGNIGIGTATPSQRLTFGASYALAFDSGANQRCGDAVLVAGTVTVANTTVTANTRVFLTRKVTGGTIGFAVTYTVIAATSFTITSDNVLDTSTYSYLLIEVP